MNIHIFFLLTAMTGFLTISACSSNKLQDTGVGITNPASEFCIKGKNGRIKIVTDESGNQRGICHLPDGTVIDEWELFRKEGSKS